MKTTKSKIRCGGMLAILILVLGLVGNASGQSSPVRLRTTVTADEDHNVIPVCYGAYFVEVMIDEILEDVNAVLTGIASLQVCYNDAQGLVLGDNVEAYGYYWAGICPKQYCGRVQILDDSHYIMRIEGYGDNDWMVSNRNMYSIPSGNVGIGTAMPQEKLHVAGNVRVEGTSPAWLDIVGGFGEDAGMRLTTAGVGVNNWEVMREGSSADFLIRETFPYPPFSGATLAVKAGSGNVGIGTTKPDEKLQVAGNVKVSGAGNGVIFPDGTKQTTAGGGADSDWIVSGNKMYSGVSGNVGIGTTSPDARLDVVSATSPAILLRGPRFGEGTIGFYKGSDWMGQMGYGDVCGSGLPGLDEAVGICSYTGTATIGTAGRTTLIVKDTGHVGIGITTPERELDVDGKVRIHSFYAGGSTYDLRVQSDGDLVASSSSKRYKEDIKDLEVDPDGVFGLRPVSFRWKESGEQDIGLIAEEVLGPIKDLVVYDQEGRPDAVKYDKVALYLLAVVKTQQQKIAALEQRVEALQGQIQ